MGATGSETDRSVPQIDLADFDARRTSITDQLWAAATEVGFFQLVNHGIALAEINQAFALAEAFFSLPDAVKAALPLDRGNNAGWESQTQVRPSTGTADRKESYQVTRPHMAALWPTEQQLPGFQSAILDFES